MVRDLAIEGGDVTVTIALTVAGCPLRNSFQEQVAREVGVGRGRGFGAARVRRDEPRRARGADDEAARRPPGRRQVDPARPDDAGDRRRLRQGRRRQVVADRQPRLGVRVARPRVGVLDADIYGHSIPHMLGISQKPVLVDKLMIPPVKHDLKLMSIGFFVDDNAAADVARADAPPGARAVPPGRPLGRARPALRRHAARHGRRLDLARPDAAARGGGRRDDAAAARAGGREPGGGDGAEDRACSCSA